MTLKTQNAPEDHVSRRRYNREKRARLEAESLLEDKSRALFEANECLRDQATALEQAVRQRTAELKDALQDAEAANAAKSAFLAMISHEIRTPLNGVMGMSTALSETELTDEQAAMIETLMASGDMVLALLNDILDLGKIEARQMDVEEIDFDLFQLVEDAVAALRVISNQRGNQLSVTMPGSLPRWVRGDPHRLRQVLANLLSNALKFTRDGTVSLCVDLRDDMLVFKVTDTGIGVPENRRNRLFKAYAQTDAAISRQFGGTGLGLSISRDVCRLMGGDIGYAPADPGPGSVFTASVRYLAGVEGGAFEEDNIDATAIMASKRWKILVAEDSQTNQKVLELLLRQYDLAMDMVSDGREALDRFETHTYDIILMDVNMPGMDGLEAATKIRESELRSGAQATPMIVLTANAMTHQVTSYLQLGFDAHVAKPVQRDKLLLEMAKLLRPVASAT
jgi:signal transduction histidine kinase/CheY-like chemotaxis protein